MAITPLTGAFEYASNGILAGFDRFSFVVSDGALQSEPTFVSVLVLGNGRPVVHGPSQLMTSEGVAALGQIQASDPDGDPLDFSVVTAPDDGTVMVSANTGSLMYTPDSGFTGGDQFDVVASDGLLTSPPFSIDVQVQ